MPERGFGTEIWDSDEWFQDLSLIHRYLFIYLWTNNHCNQAGLYHITMKTISDESLVPRDELPGLLNSLEPRVKWYPEQNIVWVKDFIKKQSKSPKFIAAAARSLLSINNNGAINELLQYYQQEYSISIPYQYYIDKLSILTRDSTSSSSADAGSVEKGVVKGEKPDAELLRMLRSLKHWRTTDDDEEWLLRFQQEFPEFGRSDLTACVDYHSGRIEARHKGEWKNRLRNWMIKKGEFAADKGGSKDDRAKQVPGASGRHPRTLPTEYTRPEDARNRYRERFEAGLSEEDRKKFRESMDSEPGPN